MILRQPRRSRRKTGMPRVGPGVVAPPFRAGGACHRRAVAGFALAARWEPGRPAAKSLWLLPSGPDQVGDDHVRPTPARRMEEPGGAIKSLATHVEAATHRAVITVHPATHRPHPRAVAPVTRIATPIVMPAAPVVPTAIAAPATPVVPPAPIVPATPVVPTAAIVPSTPVMAGLGRRGHRRHRRHRHHRGEAQGHQFHTLHSRNPLPCPQDARVALHVG